APEKERAQFVAMAVRRAAPFPDPDHGVAWTAGHTAAVWYWSRARVAARLEDDGIVARRIEFSPESLHLGSAREDGGELLQASSGTEGRVWREGRLLASRWWPQTPTPEQWQSLLRSAGQREGIPEPVPVAAPLAMRPWNAATSAVKGLGRLSDLDTYLPRIAAALGLAVLAVLSFQLGSLLRNHADIWRARAAAQDLDAPLERILEAREAANDDLGRIDGLLALRQGQPLSRLMAEVVRVNAGDAWTIRRWSQPTPDRLELTMSMSAPNPQALVTAWEESPLFEGV